MKLILDTNHSGRSLESIDSYERGWLFLPTVKNKNNIFVIKAKFAITGSLSVKRIAQTSTAITELDAQKKCCLIVFVLLPLRLCPISRFKNVMFVIVGVTNFSRRFSVKRKESWRC